MEFIIESKFTHDGKNYVNGMSIDEKFTEDEIISKFKKLIRTQKFIYKNKVLENKNKNDIDTTLTKLFARILDVLNTRENEIKNWRLECKIESIANVDWEIKQRLEEQTYIRNQITKVFSEVE